MEPSLLSVAEVDGRQLLAAAEIDWSHPVPHCPGWDSAGLVRHTGEIFMWMAAVVTSGDRVSRRTLAAPPETLDALGPWYLASLDRVLAVLGSIDPDQLTWTFSSTGDQRAGWWCRRLAVEVAIHRWDVEHAIGTDGLTAPGPVDGTVAAAGIEEFVIEFLPGLVAQEGVEGVGGTLCLLATDGPVGWRIDLDRGGQAAPEHDQADITVRGTRSDLLLWLTNRGPLPALEIIGDPSVAEAWYQLRR